MVNELVLFYYNLVKCRPIQPPECFRGVIALSTNRVAKDMQTTQTAGVLSLNFIDRKLLIS